MTAAMSRKFAGNVLAALMICGPWLLLLFAPIVLAGHGYGHGGHWARGGDPQAQMKFLDKSSSAWPVNVTSIDWDESNHIDVRYGYEPSGAICVDNCVSTDDIYPNQDPYEILGENCTGSYAWSEGNVTSLVGAGNHYVDEGERIRFNKTCSSDLVPRVRRVVACQELGHSLGLNHRNDAQQTSTCMHNPPQEAQEYPDDHDRSVVASRHDH